MKYRVDFRVQRRTETGWLICEENEFRNLNAVNAEDAAQQVFDEYEGTPHSVHIENIAEG